MSGCPLSVAGTTTAENVSTVDLFPGDTVLTSVQLDLSSAPSWNVMLTAFCDINEVDLDAAGVLAMFVDPPIVDGVIPEETAPTALAPQYPDGEPGTFSLSSVVPNLSRGTVGVHNFVLGLRVYGDNGGFGLSIATINALAVRVA